MRRTVPINNRPHPCYYRGLERKPCAGTAHSIEGAISRWKGADAGELTAPIGVDDEGSSGLTLAQGHAQSGNREGSIKDRTHGPANHPPAAKVEHGDQIQPALAGEDTRGIGDPDLIAATSSRHGQEVYEETEEGSVAGLSAKNCNASDRTRTNLRKGRKARPEKSKFLSACAPNVSDSRTHWAITGDGHADPLARLPVITPAHLRQIFFFAAHIHQLRVSFRCHRIGGNDSSTLLCFPSFGVI